jgi:hypothetical protein
MTKSAVGEHPMQLSLATVIAFEVAAVASQALPCFVELFDVHQM